VRIAHAFSRKNILGASCQRQSFWSAHMFMSIPVAVDSGLPDYFRPKPPFVKKKVSNIYTRQLTDR